MIKRWLPFRLLPASWGLVGDAYLEAEAHYKLQGEALERQLLLIRLRDDPQRLERELVEVAVRYGAISEYQARSGGWNFPIRRAPSAIWPC